MELKISAEKCTGQGRCYSLAPGLLGYDDEGYVSARGQTIVIPPGEEAAARTAVSACPEGAISLG